MGENNLHKFLRSVIIVLSVLIISSLILLVALVIKRKSINKKQDSLVHNNLYTSFKTLNIKDLSFPTNCPHEDPLFKDNYIAIYSKKCGIIKIITLR